MKRYQIICAVLLSILLWGCTGQAEPETPTEAATQKYTEVQQQPVTLAETQSDDQEAEIVPSMQIIADDQSFSVQLYDNETVKALLERLPLTLEMEELNGNEKYFYLPEQLPADAHRPAEINAGDLMLYGSDCLVLFYESFPTSFSYTPLGHMNDSEGLAAALGSGSVTVTFQIN